MRPLLHNDASTEASRAFNSCPTSPSIDFSRGYLLSFCIYRLLETQRLLVTPRQVWRWAFGAHPVWYHLLMIETLDLCDLVSH